MDYIGISMTGTDPTFFNQLYNLFITKEPINNLQPDRKTMPPEAFSQLSPCDLNS